MFLCSREEACWGASFLGVPVWQVSLLCLGPVSLDLTLNGACRKELQFIRLSDICSSHMQIWLHHKSLFAWSALVNCTWEHQSGTAVWPVTGDIIDSIYARHKATSAVPYYFFKMQSNKASNFIPPNRVWFTFPLGHLFSLLPIVHLWNSPWSPVKDMENIC